MGYGRTNAGITYKP